MYQLTPNIDTLPPYNVLRQEYNERYSLGNLDTDIQTKFALISLICHITVKAKDKKPDMTHYSVIRSIAKDLNLPENFIKGLAVVCEDFSYNCTSFPLFNLKGNEIIDKVKEILKNYIPF